jgi:hypothetical protein
MEIGPYHEEKAILSPFLHWLDRKGPGVHFDPNEVIPGKYGEYWNDKVMVAAAVVDVKMKGHMPENVSDCNTTPDGHYFVKDREDDIYDALMDHRAWCPMTVLRFFIFSDDVWVTPAWLAHYYKVVSASGFEYVDGTGGDPFPDFDERHVDVADTGPALRTSSLPPPLP